MRGKGQIKITIVTAYNATPGTGDNTYHQQQDRGISRMQRQQIIHGPPQPRQQFILDLQSWLQHLQREGHQIILAMDTNATYDTDNLGTAHDLTYTPGNLTQDKRHNGKLSTLLASCSLLQPLAIQHTTRPFLASHIHGRNQIDCIFVSESMLPAVRSSGVLSHHSLLHGDHRPYYIDLDTAGLFSEPAYDIAQASSRTLRLHDPWLVSKYIEVMHEKLQEHTVPQRLASLLDTVKKGQWTDHHTEVYNSLDATITEAMLFAENSTSRRITTTYQWSPQLKQAVHCL